MSTTHNNRLAGRIPLREGMQAAVWETLTGLGFQRLQEVGDTTPFSREEDDAEAELIEDGRGLSWLDYREIPAPDEQRLFSTLPRLRVSEIASNLQAPDAAQYGVIDAQRGQLRLIQSVVYGQRAADCVGQRERTWWQQGKQHRQLGSSA